MIRARNQGPRVTRELTLVGDDYIEVKVDRLKGVFGKNKVAGGILINLRAPCATATTSMLRGGDSARIRLARPNHDTGPPMRLKRCFPAAPIVDVEDAVAEATADWWARYQVLDDTRMERWVLMRARWRLVDLLRRGLSEVTLREGHLVTGGPDALVERAEAMRRAARATLSPATQAVIDLWLFDWTSPEIAARLQVSPAVVRRRVARAIVRCREAVLEAADPDGCHTLACSFVIRLGDAEEEQDGEGRKEGRKEGSTFHATTEVNVSYPVRSGVGGRSVFNGLWALSPLY